MDFDSREKSIHANFIRPMTKMYTCPKNIQNDVEAKKMYGQEIRKAINSRISTKVPNQETFDGLVKKVWDRCVTEQSYRIWFTPAMIAKHASKINAEWQHRYESIDRALAKVKEEPEENRGRKDEPATQGWTIEKCDMHIEEMEHLISTGGIQKDIGRALMGIPLAAKRRLQGAE